MKHETRTSSLALAALGVVFGDIGTSPLYTMKEIFGGAHHPVPITPEHILGILSVIFWSLIVVVTLKYVSFIMRADNKGEGGIMALMALVLHGVENRGQAAFLMLLGLFGAALFYGDSVLTPAISVLSAIEGLEVATPALKSLVVPLSLLVLVGLFLVQRRGTAEVGRWFGPVIVLWFLSLGVMGIAQIAANPVVLNALLPSYALIFFQHDPMLAFFALGATVLALTGGEALYADMGHFGRRPIQLAWFAIVLPGLVLNYFGQGALLLAHPEAIQNPFYLMAPDWALLPLVGLSTAATVIASQAVISGAYSMTRQAIQLGYAPRLEVLHTSSHEIGQIYLPGINWALMVAVAVLVLAFGSSSALAAAYGIAVTGTMVITTILAMIVVRRVWHWHPAVIALVIGSVLVVDLAYFSANAVKIHQGGWFPLALGAVVFLAMTTWKRGRQLLNARLLEESIPLDVIIADSDNLPQIPGTAVFMTPNPKATPHALLHSLKHYKSLHERVVILTVAVLDEPHAHEAERLAITPLSERFFRVHLNFGFMETPNLPLALEACAQQGLNLELMDTSFFLGRETVIPQPNSGMSLWREKLFVTLFRNAGSAASYFHLPPNRVIELGTQVVL